jgi:hypothetical protein
VFGINHGEFNSMDQANHQANAVGRSLFQKVLGDSFAQVFGFAHVEQGFVFVKIAVHPR